MSTQRDTSKGIGASQQAGVCRFHLSAAHTLLLKIAAPSIQSEHPQTGAPSAIHCQLMWQGQATQSWLGGSSFSPHLGTRHSGGLCQEPQTPWGDISNTSMEKRCHWGGAQAVQQCARVRAHPGIQHRQHLHQPGCSFPGQTQ